MKKILFLVLLLCYSLILSACSKEKTQPQATTPQITTSQTKTSMPNELQVQTQTENEIPMTFLLDDGLLTEDQKNQHIAAAWLGYAMSRGAWIKDHFTMENFKNNTYVHSFDEEVSARGDLTQIWLEIKENNPQLQLTDTYLDSVLKVRDAGFLKEYVWVYLMDLSWTSQPEGLRLEEFKNWAKTNLVDHVAQTRATVEIDNTKIK